MSVTREMVRSPVFSMQDFTWWLGSLRDWLRASDPGRGRLSMAFSAAAGVASTLLVEYGFAQLTGAGKLGGLVAMLLGSVVTMMGTMALTGTAFWPKVKVAAFFPLAIGLGMVLGIAAGRQTDIMLAVFVLVMFAAVAVRRLGAPFFFYGFMGWMGYFFASFMHASLAMIPSMLGAVVVASVWVLLLASTVLASKPRRTLERMVGDFGALTRSALRACSDLLAGPDTDGRGRLRRRLHARLAQLSEAALMVEGWSAEPGAFPPDRSAPALRRRLIDVQHVLDRIAGSSEVLTEAGGKVASSAAAIAQQLSRGEGQVVRQAARALLAEAADLPQTQSRAATVIAHAAYEYSELAPPLFDPLHRAIDPDEQLNDEFQPVVGLAMGNLPGSAAVAQGVNAKGAAWNPLARLDLPLRQAVQVAVAGALAIIFGRMLSPVRYYWAVIAAFVMFTGTATQTETVLKGFNRVLGTLAGLAAAIWLAELTAGHVFWVLAVILASMFFGFYLIRLSYGFMIFFITIMVGQLYSVLGEFSSGLLVLRLEETAIGAAVGFAVALSVVPLSTIDTVRSARNGLLEALAVLLDAAAEQMAGRSTADFDSLSRTLDNRLRALALVAKPLTRPIIGDDSSRVRHRLALYASIITGARALAVALRNGAPEGTADLAASCRSLARTARTLQDDNASVAAIAAVGGESLGRLDGVGLEAEAVRRRVVHLGQVLQDLASHRGRAL